MTRASIVPVLLDFLMSFAANRKFPPLAYSYRFIDRSGSAKRAIVMKCADKRCLVIIG
jgi:hypothetical protein